MYLKVVLLSVNFILKMILNLTAYLLLHEIIFLLYSLDLDQTFFK